MADLILPPVTDEDFTDIGSTTTSTDEGPQIRLLRCTHCRTLEELPDYQGDPRDDHVLDHLVSEHQRKHPFHDDKDAYLLRVSERAWRNPKIGRKIHDKIWEDLKSQGLLGGFVPSYYESKNTFVEDANKCFNQHRRSIPCIDWQSDRKRIGNPTKEGWDRGEVKVYLCSFCPVASAVMEVRNKQLGRYDD